MRSLLLMFPIVVVPILAACGNADEQLHCDDLLPASAVSYTEVAALVTSPGAKGCARCHNVDTPIYGYDFEGPGVAYDSLRAKMELVYPQVASGAMPQDGARWGASELRILRSWYCRGALYDNP